MDSGNSSNNTRPLGEGCEVREGKSETKGRKEEAYRELDVERRDETKIEG